MVKRKFNNKKYIKNQKKYLLLYNILIRLF